MSDHESLRAELARVTEERDALLAERERTAPLVAAATEYAAACEARRAARRRMRLKRRSAASDVALAEAASLASDAQDRAQAALLVAARAMRSAER